MLPLGTAAPDFRLPDVNGKMVGLADFKAAPALVVLFICNHCPYVKHIRAGLAAFGRDAQKRGAAVVPSMPTTRQSTPRTTRKK